MIVIKKNTKNRHFSVFISNGFQIVRLPEVAFMFKSMNFRRPNRNIFNLSLFMLQITKKVSFFAL